MDVIKIENLSIGMVLKNYLDLCRVLEVEPKKSSSSRQLHLKDIQRYFSFHKDGYKIIIDEIYENPISKVDKRGLNENSHINQTGAYGKYIRLLVLNMLSQNENQDNSNVVIVGKNNMLEELNMINQNYRYNNYNRTAMASYLGMDLDSVHEFFNTNTKKLKQAVETTLNRLMQNEKLVFWSNTKMLSRHNVVREATEEEIKLIINCETEVLEEMGTKEMAHIYATNQVKPFYQKVNKLLRAEGIAYSYNAYKIIFADIVYKRSEQLNYRLEVPAIEENKSELNSTLFTKLNESAVNRYDKVNKEFKKFSSEEEADKWLDKNNGYKRLVMEDGFIQNNKLLVDICIDSTNDTYDSICEEVAKAWEYSKRKSDTDKTDDDLTIDFILSL